MTQRQATVVRDLANPVYKAIPIIAKKAGKKCPECKGVGDLRTSHKIDSTGHFEICPACNGTGKISQQEMIRLAKESVVKKELGKYQLVYKKDRKTIVAEPREWEWKPKMGEWCIYFDRIVLCVDVDGVTGEVGFVDIKFSDRLSAIRYRPPQEFVPILHWEKLEEILEGFGWFLWDMKRTVPSSDGTGSLVVVELAKGELVKCGRGKDRQEAFQRAVIELEDKER